VTDPIAPTLNLADIQGNIIGAFNKDFQEFIYVAFGEGLSECLCKRA
jgi:hypothetical protein